MNSPVSSGSVGTLLDRLPNEVLEIVVWHCDEFTALHALVTANPRAKTLFERKATQILENLLGGSAMEPDLHCILRTILSLRQYRESHSAFTTLQAYINEQANCRLHDVEGLKNLHVFKDLSVEQANTFLEGASSTCTNMVRIEESFIKKRLPKITSKIRNKLVENRFSNKHQPILADGSTKELIQRRISSEEHHRIRRAILYLHLYYEAFYLPFLQWEDDIQKLGGHCLCCAHSKFKASFLDSITCVEGRQYFRDYQYEFFLQLSIWEIEEMECVYYHLQHDPGLFWDWQCPSCRIHLLPDDMLGHNRECQSDKRYQCNLPNAVRWARENFKHFYAVEFLYDVGVGKVLTPLRDPLARQPSAGFSFLMGHRVEICPGEFKYGMTRSPLKDFHDWGYCMWDRQRLAEWRLIDSDDGSKLAELSWWRDL